ncbi:hypothetical protein IOQ59_13615 [Pontibacterium sp. N1Y112]|uniref:Lipoprotein n=1 Tax=Pontibacterium sinense TaxID=2781979 RepID=A0A8J7JZY4_9GAMM|nr:hypothetical protein [Pontibacterium sinense]MBE9398294.1 hypothetical protein [Pontibacterium sinense]
MFRNKFLMRVLLAGFFAILSGCSATTSMNSEVWKKPDSPVSNMSVLYIHREFRSTVDSSVMYGWLNYDQMPKLMKEYAPKVLELNGFSGSRTYSTDGKDSDYLLVVEFLGSNNMAMHTHGASVVFMYAEAKLVSRKNNEKIWSIRLSNSMGMGALNDILFDEQFTYGLMETVLNKMHVDQIISLNNGKVVMPAQKQSG